MTAPAPPRAPASPRSNDPRNRKPIVLTSHPGQAGSQPRIAWGAGVATERGPVVATLRNLGGRNAIGTHAGAYSLYRALGEVTKFLVYNARKRQEGGDTAETYFQRTKCVAGVSDMRFQELMPDVLHWLGITRIDRLVSMSNMKFAPIVDSGIEVIERVPIPDDLIPADASVEMDAKKAAGYFSASVPDGAELLVAKGRGLEE